MLAFLLLFFGSDLARGAALYDSDAFIDSLEVSLGLPFGSSMFNISVLGSNGVPGIGNYSKILPSPGHLHGHPSKTRKVPRSHPADLRPTPAPTGNPSPITSVHIDNEHDFAILLPEKPQESIADAETDGVTYCSFENKNSACTHHLEEGFVRATAVTHSDDGAWIQITGCIDPSKSTLDHSDDGGQFDVRFPNGAQCTFGGYGASFIQQVEPSANRFCLRCCASANDQLNCNSHQDRAGCTVAIPGKYNFPELGVDCS